MKFREMRRMGLIPRKGDKEFHTVMKSLKAATRAELESLVLARRKAEEQRKAMPRPVRMGHREACYWCGLPFDPLSPTFRRTREHLVPVSMGGRGLHGNVVGAHSICNNQRGDRLNWIPYAVHQRRGYRVPFDDDHPEKRLPVRGVSHAG